MYERSFIILMFTDTPHEHANDVLKPILILIIRDNNPVSARFRAGLRS